MVQTDDIDELVSSVRDFVSHKEPPRSRSRILLDRLILTPEQRVHDDETANTPVNVDHAPVGPLPPVATLPPVQSFNKAGLEATIAELEAAVTAQFDDWEADEGETFAKEAWAASAFPDVTNDSAKSACEAPTFTHAAPADDADRPHQPNGHERIDAVPNGKAPVDDAALTASVLAGLDEKALRGLVAEIVHEELGGELGERITRNVRKMVRREINRILTSREMGQD